MNKADKVENKGDLASKMAMGKRIQNDKKNRVTFIINGSEEEFYFDFETPQVLTEKNTDEIKIKIEYDFYHTKKWKKYVLSLRYEIEVDTESESEDINKEMKSNFDDSYYRLSGEVMPYEFDFSFASSAIEVKPSTGEEIGELNKIGMSKQGYIKFSKLLKENFHYIESHPEVKKNTHAYNLAKDSFKKLLSKNYLKRFFKIVKHGTIDKSEFSELKHNKKKTLIDIYKDGTEIEIPTKLDVNGLVEAYKKWLDSPKGASAKKHLKEMFDAGEFPEMPENFFQMVSFFGDFIAYSLGLNIEKMKKKDISPGVVFIFESITEQGVELMAGVNVIGKYISDNF